MVPFTYTQRVEFVRTVGCIDFALNNCRPAKTKLANTDKTHIYIKKVSSKCNYVAQLLIVCGVCNWLMVWRRSAGTIRSKHSVVDVVYGKCWGPQTRFFYKIAMFFFFFLLKGSLRSYKDVVWGANVVDTYSTTL